MVKVYGYAQTVSGEQVYGRLIDERYILKDESIIINIKLDSFKSDNEIRVKKQEKQLSLNNRKANTQIKKINKLKDVSSLATPEMLGKYLAIIMTQFANEGIPKEDEYTYEYEKEKALEESEYKEVFE